METYMKLELKPEHVTCFEEKTLSELIILIRSHFRIPPGISSIPIILLMKRAVSQINNSPGYQCISFR